MITCAALMNRWHELADRVESIADDAERRAVCAEMDRILVTTNMLDRQKIDAERSAKDADAADLAESQDGWRL